MTYLRPATLFLGFLFSLLMASCQQEPAPPNVLFIAVDDLRPELSCYGEQKIISPNIDKLASQGLLFERAYCNVPVCGASRASLLTGIRPSRNRFVGYSTKVEKDFPTAITLPHHFRRNGYTSISLGKVFHHLNDMADSSWSKPPWHPSHTLPKGAPSWRNYISQENIEREKKQKIDPNASRGMPYEKMDVPDSAYFDGKTANKAIKELASFADSKEPFFLAVGFLKPHLPFNAPTKYWDMYKEEDIDLADNPYLPTNAPEEAYHSFGELRHYAAIPPEGPVPDSIAKKLVHGYKACVSYTDAQIGRVMDALEELGLEENTIVVLWGDHGWQLGEHGLWCKHSTFHNALNTPLLLKVPGKQGGTKTKSLTEFVDIYPTLCELVNLPKPQQLDGQSLVSLLSNPDASLKEAVYSRYHQTAAIRTDRYLYSEWFDEDRNGYARMLYDHQIDPEENTNISEMPENKELVNTLSNKLRQMEASVSEKQQ